MTISASYQLIFAYLPSGSLAEANGSGYTITPTDGSDTITAGEAVTVDGIDASFDCTYLGVTADGEMVLSASSDGVVVATFVFTDTFSNDLLLGVPAYSAAVYPACFAAGTQIATPAGAVRVENLRAGDVILTADGGTTLVKWLGQQTLATVFADAVHVCPIRIRAGALAHGVPSRDLLVSGDHGLVLGEAIVQANALVNGTTIAREAKADLGATVTYFHIETEGHAVILAEGAAAETFIDTAGREKFDNFAELVAMYGPEQDDIEPLTLPRAKSAREVPAAIKARIAARVAQLFPADHVA